MRRSAIASALALALIPASAVLAGSTKDFLLDSDEDLSAGELEGTAAHSNGTVTTGADVRRLELGDVSVAWSFARGDDGSVYIGTGNEGKIYRLKGEQLSVFAETGQLLVSALAMGPRGTLYAGTLPEGRIYAVDSKGTVKELARPEKAEHIWALVWDPKRKVLFAGTGPEGKVLSIRPGGQVDEYYDADAGHIMSLALDTDGSLYAGTSDEALVVRLRGPGRAEVLHDLPGNEVTAIDVREGVVAAAANEFPDPPKVRTTSTSKGAAPRPKPGKGQLWTVRPDGQAERLFKLDKAHLTDVQIGEDGTIFASAGVDGRIYRVTPDRTSATWVDVDERQVLAMDMLGREPLFLTGDAGAVYRVLAGKPREATWTSKVLDAKFNARWGQLSWRANGQLDFQTRSGNTGEPDATWSEWSTPTQKPGPVRSAPARFLQVRARFQRDADAVLRAVRIYYLPQNQRPVVRQVRLKTDKKEETKKKKSAAKPDESPAPSTHYELTWDVDNEDGDDVRYRLAFRAEGQRIWRDILSEDEVLTKTTYKWQTDSVPDGWYVVRVEGSDELSNPDGLTLRSSDESEPFLVDNHAPRFEGLRVQGGKLTGRAVDSLGPVDSLEVAVDGGEWRVLFPKDGIFDTRDERFEVDLGDLGSGEHIVAVRATDAGGNMVSAELTTGTARRSR